mmetsp:Transcript_13764/g.19725  ORF Transcript_13764/g.19725 Transcript_13764/m.19725 type:complete len:406 (+) Transcript_13764:132-1349(+)
MIILLLVLASAAPDVSLALIGVPRPKRTVSLKQPLLQRNSVAKLPISLVEVAQQNMSDDLDTDNLSFSCIKNARDLAFVSKSPILPNRVYRTGKLSDANEDDIDLLLKRQGIRTVVDLRSPTELKEDDGLHRPEVFGNFRTIRWKEGKRTRFIVGDGHHKHFNPKIQTKGLNAQVVVPHHQSALPANNGAEISEKELQTTKERHFVSLMNEYKYVRGVVRKLRKRDMLKLVLQSPGALFSKRVRRALKSVFLDEINDGGLPLLNELMLRMGASGIRYVLELVSDVEKHPVLFHCTAGKDRTGIVAALILALVGVPDDAIVEDYALSANVYAQINDHTAMVGALSQRNLDPKTFLGAPPQVMQDTLDSIRETYGSIEGYCDWIGFGPESREKLICALTTESFPATK